MSQRKSAKHKHTVYCTVNGCKYTSRQWVFKSQFKFSQKESVFSTKCPKHQTELVTIDKIKQK
jgi:hypothetical protein